MPKPNKGPTVVVFDAHASGQWLAALEEELIERGGHLLLVRATQAPAPGRQACVTHFAADAAQPDKVRGVFDQMARHGQHPELVIFDGGQTQARAFLDWTPEEARHSWQRESLAAFVVGLQAMTPLLARERGTVLFIGRSEQDNLAGPFSMRQANKAATRAVAQSMARAFGPKNIHVAHISLGIEPPERSIDAARALARACWHLHGQHRSAWTHEMDLRPR